MLKQVFKFSLVLVLALSTFLTSCDSEEESLTVDGVVEDYVDEVIFRMEESGSFGRFGCFELVFPIGLEFPDASTQSVEDYDGLRTAIQEWKEANPDAEEKPTLVFPIDVLSEEGELITVTDQEELRALKRECRSNWFNGNGPRGHRNKCGSCFDLVFPISIQLPDGTTEAAADRAAFKTLIRDWKEANPDAEERPELVFPIQVELEEDGSVVTINSAEELAELRESCSEG